MRLVGSRCPLRDIALFLVDCGKPDFNSDLEHVSMEGCMGKIYRFLAVLVFAFVGLVGGGYESRAGVDANLDREMEMKQGLRDLWLGHIF